MDLNSPCLTPETLDSVLEYIYTGRLPPPSLEELVFSAAFYLQMEQLQQVLRRRNRASGELIVPVQDKLSQKGRSVDQQPLYKNPPVSPSHYPYDSDRPTPCSPTYEVVPVICHIRAAGSNKLPPQSHRRDRHSTLNAECCGGLLCTEEPSHHGSPQSSHRLENGPLLERFSGTSRWKQDKVLSERSGNDLQSVVSEEVNGWSGESGRLRSVLPEDSSQTTTDLRPNTDNKDQCVESARTSTESHPQLNRCASSGSSKCVSDINSIKFFNAFDSGKGDHLVEIYARAFSDKNSGPVDGSQCCDQFATNYCDVPMCLEDSSSTDTSDMTCERRTFDTDVWPEVIQLHTQRSMIERKPSEMGSQEKGAVDQADNIDLSISRENDMSVYQGQVRYHCLLERPRPAVDSSDSDSEQACPLPGRCTTLGAEPARGRRSKPRPFQCSLCSRPFSQRGSLNRHVRSHLGVRPYSCPRCTMTFSRQYRVTEHMRVHLRNYEAPPSGHLRIGDIRVDV
ncbi:uncharacterized protein LOC143518637 isoform X2 [Brachyhypopomus gauderio]